MKSKAYKVRIPDLFLTTIWLSVFCFTAYGGEQESINKRSPFLYRADGALELEISLNGSLQNPAWSPDAGSLLFTRFRNGYNAEPADLLIIDLGDNSTKTLVSDGSGNVNLPGSSWNAATHKIVFSSTRDPHDEIFIIDEDGIPGDEAKITDRENFVAYEPSFSSDGEWVVFESHQLNVEGDGVITKYEVDGTGSYQMLTDIQEDCRQPNWSPAGDLILYQKLANGQWDIWITNTDGTNHQKITSGSGNKTDASFSPDGQWIVYSSDEGGLEFANLFIIKVSGGNPIRVTNYNGYDGAPSWSPDGRKIAFESYPGDPDDTSGTTLWIIDAPEVLNTSNIHLTGITTNLSESPIVGDAITFTATGEGLGTIYYRFLYKGGYGTAAYNNPGGWVIVKNWNTDNTATITFLNADNYIIIVQATHDSNGAWTFGDPQGGMNIYVANPSDLQLSSITTSNLSGIPTVGDPITVSANSVDPAIVYYRFLYKAGYGTEAFNTPGGFVIVQDWSTDNIAAITFPSADNYIVIVQATEDSTGVWALGDPQGGISIKVGSH